MYKSWEKNIAFSIFKTIDNKNKICYGEKTEKYI